MRAKSNIALKMPGKRREVQQHFYVAVKDLIRTRRGKGNRRLSATKLIWRAMPLH